MLQTATRRWENWGQYFVLPTESRNHYPLKQKPIRMEYSKLITSTLMSGGNWDFHLVDKASQLQSCHLRSSVWEEYLATYYLFCQYIERNNLYFSQTFLLSVRLHTEAFVPHILVTPSNDISKQVIRSNMKQVSIYDYLPGTEHWYNFLTQSTKMVRNVFTPTDLFVAWGG